MHSQPTNSNPIGAVLLAAGLNERMAPHSHPKCLLPLSPGGSTSFLSRHIESLTSCQVQEIVVVGRVGFEGAYEAMLGNSAQLVPSHYDPAYFGSASSLLIGLAQVMARLPDNASILVIDADTVYEKRLLRNVIGKPGSHVFAIASEISDEEDVLIYTNPLGHPAIIGKNVPECAVKTLRLLGESIGIVSLQSETAAIAIHLINWLIQPNGKSYGIGGSRAEHEDVWQMLFAMGAIDALRIDDGILMSECDTPEDYERITKQLFPKILDRDAELKPI